MFEAIAVGDNGFSREVAIKRLLQPLTRDGPLRRSFLDEARISSRLSHPNIVSILDFGVADGVPFQVLERVRGTDLGSLLARGPLPLPVAIHIVIEIARALEYAHSALDESGEPLGIVHRDVTPGNILVSSTGDVKLSDFGIARAHDRLETTALGVVKGTLAYMAPEQARGAALDGRTDLFSLGCVLHRLVAGRSPLEDEAARKRVIAGGSVVIDPGVPEAIAQLIERATRSRKEDRYPNAGAMVEACWRTLTKESEREGHRMLRDWLADLEPEPDVSDTANLFTLEVSGEDDLGFRQFTTVSLEPPPTRTNDPPEWPISGWTMLSLGLAITVMSAVATLVVVSSSDPIDPGDPLTVSRRAPAPPAVVPSVIPRAPPPPARAFSPNERQAGPRRAVGRPRRRLPSPEAREPPRPPEDPPARLRAILDRLKRSGPAIPLDELASLEARYFDLRERLGAVDTPEARRLLLRDLDALERDVSTADR